MRVGKRSVLKRDFKTDYRMRNAHPDFNYAAHETLHAPRYMVYTSFADFTTPGSLQYPPRAGMLTQIRAALQVAATGTFSYNVLKNGNSILDAAISFVAGTKVHTFKQFIKVPYFLESDYFQVSITSASDATGPLVVWMEYVPTDFF